MLKKSGSYKKSKGDDRMNKPLLICWATMSLLFTIDMVTTLIGVFGFGLTEKTILYNNLFNYGILGFSTSYFLSICMLIFLLVFSGEVFGIISKYSKVKINKAVIYCIVCSMYVVESILTILNNIGNIIGAF